MKQQAQDYLVGKCSETPNRDYVLLNVGFGHWALLPLQIFSGQECHSKKYRSHSSSREKLFVVLRELKWSDHAKVEEALESRKTIDFRMF